MKTKRFLNKYYKHISLVLLLFSIIPFIIISFYSRPCADDYNYSINMHNMVLSGNWNIFTVIKTAFITDMEFMQFWQGLYSAAFLQSLQPGSFGEQYYFIGTVVLIVMMFAGTYYFIKTVFKVFNIEMRPLLPSIIMLTIYLHGMPDIVQGLYWYCGAYDYIPFAMLNLVNISYILNYYDSNGRKSLYYLVLTDICSFILSGGNHVNSFANILILVLFCIYSLWKKKKYGVFSSLISALFGFGIMLNAPGTKIRMNSFEGSGVFNTIYATFFRFLRLIFSRVYINARFAIFLFLLVLVAAMIRGNKKIKEISIHPILLFLIFCMILCGMLAVPYYAMGTFGSGRLKNSIWIIFMIFAGVFWVYTLIWLDSRYERFNRLMDLTERFDKSIFVPLCCLLLLLSSGNVFSIIGELNDGTAKTFAAQYDERYEMMKNHKGDEILVFDPIIDSQTLKFDDLSDNINDWRNRSWYEYYGVQAIVIEQPNK